MLFGDGPKGNKFANARVGKNNIELPRHLGNGLVKTVKVGEFGDVTLNARDIAADCLHGLVEFFLAAARDEDISTLFDEKFCRSEPNSFCASRDDSYLASEFFRHRLSPLLLSSELTIFDRALLITCVRGPLVQGDRRDGWYGLIGWRSDCAKHLWRNLLPTRPNASGANRTRTLFQTPSVI